MCTGIQGDEIIAQGMGHSKGSAITIWIEHFGIGSVWDYFNPARPAFGDVRKKPWRVNHQPVSMPVQKLFQPQAGFDQNWALEHNHGNCKCWPQVADFKQERDS